ncbi:hypothetical protein SAMN04489761_4323 [Tenacibaculum sp. MAR_2009_124]|uniref:hypothetical protein n=1 Tax=Tenacibaculum sp. MAR_2009_124 TaxID=1250059 RepID=UPI0008953054|nr:hypothetical protein [Tenacibaculum sp. MAR_2009_124]SED11667.1 hypothetical protein SAMN04489761_4323 [Tenacibaculum sp. MAR_2009_124]
MTRKVILEGTEKEIENLLELIQSSNINLPKICTEYQTENLWQIQDVQSKYNCTDEEAMETLEAALTNEATMDQIWFAIDIHVEEEGLEKIIKG